MSAPADLSGLRRTDGPEIPEPRRSAVTRVVLPAALLAGFLAVGLWAGRDALREPMDVRTVPVVVRDSTAAIASGGVRAAGWIEPSPSDVRVAALVDGVLTEMRVVEGDTVAAGDVVARIDDRVARVAVATAEARVAVARAAVDAARGRVAAFESRLVAARSVDEAGAAARTARLAADAAAEDARAARESRDAAIVRATRARAGAAAGTASVADAEAAESAAREATARAAAADVRSTQAADTADVAATAAAAARELVAAGGLGSEALGVLRADAAAADADLAAASASLDAARLHLELHTVRAAAAGVVLERLAAAGSAVTTGDGAVARLYDPTRLQVRVDVPFADASRIVPGARARITAEAIPGRTFEGTVLRIVPFADAAKATVQAKVAIASPDPALRPDMLVRVEVAAAETGGGAPVASRKVVLAPERVVRTDAAGRFVWVVEDGRAVRRSVTLGGARDGEWVEVASGLVAGDDVIDGDPAGLAEGRSVRTEASR